jgi:hypothetical protein
MLRKILLIGFVVGLTTAVVFAGSAQAGKPQVQLSYHLYSFDDGSFVVDYVVAGKGAGNMDLAVSHQCFSDGALVQDWTNRLYWSGNGANKEGHWNTHVEGGNECFAVVVDVSQPVSGETSFTSSGYREVSPMVQYVVE